MSQFVRQYWGLLLAMILSFWAVSSFFTPGFFSMHDDTQVVRVQQMAQALADGHFPVRWVKDLGYGYGYPLFNFYAPLPYYFGGILGMLGFGALTATKIMMVVGILLSGLFMYLLARQFWGEIGGTVSALFYMYAPYHAVDIYVRGAVGEFWAYGFLPLMALGLYRRWVIVGGIGFAGVILSHNLTAMMLTPFLVIATLLNCYITYKKRKLYPIHYTLYPILLGLGLSAFYWLPALLELGFTNVQSQIGGGADFRDHFVCWQQLWQSEWGFGGSAPGCVDGLSLKIGKLHIIASFIVLIGSIFFWKKDRLQSAVVPLAFGFLLLAIFLMLEISKPLWESIAPMGFLQYPWRFLLLASFFSSFLAGGIVLWRLRRFESILLFLLLIFNIKLFEPQTILPQTVDDYINGNNIKWVTSKLSDEYMPRDFAKPMFTNDTVKRRISIEKIKVDKTQELVFETNENEIKTVLVLVAPFPAWQVFIDGTSTSYVSRNNGIEVTIPQGTHTIKLLFVQTAVEKIGNSISFVSTILLLSGILKFSKTYAKS